MFKVGQKILNKTIATVVLTVLCTAQLTEGRIFRQLQTQSIDKTQQSALVIFAHFADEGIGSKPPSWSKDLFNVTIPGSFSHFYQDMSGGLLTISGAVLPKRYASFEDRNSYVASESSGVGDYGRFNLEILSQADSDTDFGAFDNDGPDGIPNSGDDDGFVDVVFINLHTVPTGFFIGTATGLASLGLEQDFVSNDKAFSGGYIRIGSRFNGFSGTTQRGHTFSVTAATMCHEFGHVLGLTDLFDQSSLSADGDLDPTEDSAGIGNWGLMGLGTLGWGIEDGPNAFSGPSLEELGWVDVVELNVSSEGFLMEELFSGRKIYKIPIHQEEYYLIEYRRSDGSFYNRNIPRDGLLIWHIDERADNDQERHKRVDLVCADGLFADKGFPSKNADEISGRDNLDFWSRDDNYANRFNGNKGDATDPFDGMQFTRFSHDSNPPLRAYTGDRRGVPLPIGLENIHEENGMMAVDIVFNELPGVIMDQTRWEGEILVDGDVVIAPSATLVLADGVKIQFKKGDARRAGFDTTRSELLVYGNLELEGEAHFFSANTQGQEGDWAGILLMDGQRFEETDVVIEHSLWGLVRFRLPEGITVWNKSNILWGDLLVPSNAELIVNSGVELLVSPKDLLFSGLSADFTELKIDGSLKVIGTPTSPVRITVRQGIVDEPIWYGIVRSADANVEIEHSRLDRAGYGISGEVSSEGFLRVADVTLRDFAASAVRLILNKEVEIVRSTMIRSTGPAVQVDGIGQLRLIDVKIEGNGREGIMINNSSFYGDRLELRENGSIDAEDLRSGIAVNSGPDSKITIKNSAIEKNSADGILLLGTNSEVDLEDSFVIDNGGTGIHIDRAKEVQLKNIKIVGNEGAGIEIDSSKVLIDEVEVKANIRHALYLGPTTSGIVSKSYFGEGLGVILESVKGLTVEENYFERTPVGLDVINSKVELMRNEFLNNNIGITIRGPSASTKIEENVFLNNSKAIENLTSEVLFAQRNYWGESDSLNILALLIGPIDFSNYFKRDPSFDELSSDDTEQYLKSNNEIPFPNPSNPKFNVFNIPVNLKESGSVKIMIWNVLGSRVFKSGSMLLNEGYQNIEWDGRNDDGEFVAPGIYFYRIWSNFSRSDGRLTVM